MAHALHEALLRLPPEDQSRPCHTPRVITYASGANKWEESDDLAPAAVPLYLGDHFSASFDKPAGEGSESYVSDPAKPVTTVPRPVSLSGPAWPTWLVGISVSLMGVPMCSRSRPAC
jgi:predicted acyl esterase